MARRRRIDPDEGWHHVMNRGAGKREVFLTAGDGRHFLRLLGEGCAQSDVEVHAYCLMGNHYHLLLRCPTGGVSKFMLRLASMYTRSLNERLGSDGPIFRSRFRSLLVDTTEYLVCAARYIHRNPLDRRPLVPLDSYPWSSYRSYTGAEQDPPWLSTRHLLEIHDGVDGLRTFTETNAPRVAPSLEWAIDTALAEREDGEPVRANARRAVELAMFDRADGAMRAELERLLAFPSDAARRMALHRARRRLASEPQLARVVERALRLVA